MVRRTQGYTIIEVSLFLAITGLLILIVLIGTGNTVRTTRFSDSNRSLHAYLQKQYDNILNGVNTRPGQEECIGGVVDTTSTQPPGASNCLLLGKLVSLKQNATTVQTFDIVGQEPANPNYNLADVDLIKTYQPTIVRNVSSDTFQIPWGAKIVGSKRLADNKAEDQFAIIRSPRSTHIVSYTFNESDLGGSNDMTGVVSNASNIEQSTNFCVNSVDAPGLLSKITATGNQGQDALQLTFDASSGDCNGQ